MTIARVWDETRGIVEMTDAEYRAYYVAKHGEELWQEINAPSIPRSEMTEGQKYMADKMQAEAETNNALAKAGLTLDDLAVEGDDEEVDFDIGPPVGDAHESVLAQLEYAYERYDKLQNDDMMAVDNAVAGFDRNGRKSPWHEDQQRWLDSVIAYLKADEKA